MSDSFNENLSMFLTSCKESALRELSEYNADYKKLCSDAVEISKKAKNEIPREYEALLDSLIDSIYALARKESNYLYFRGFKDCVSLYKRFDASFAESEEFERFFT